MRELRKDHKKYVNNHYLTRDGVVPFYTDLILTDNDPFSKEVKRINDLILSKWTRSGLLYIKDKAWKQVLKLKENEPL